MQTSAAGRFRIVATSGKGTLTRISNQADLTNEKWPVLRIFKSNLVRRSIIIDSW